MQRITIILEDALYQELKAAVSREPMSPETWATEAVESALASRRLPFVRPSASAVRLPGAVENMMDPRPAMAEHRAAGPLVPSEIPTLTELRSVEDIT
ncbi:MAG: hypothetical protein WCC22_02205 [Terriglobales bacterium]